MGQPTIYEPSIYNGNGVYNNGGGGGGGGGSAYFNCDVATSSSIALMKSEDKIRKYLTTGAGTGGFVIAENLYNQDIKEIEFNISFYRASSGGTGRVVSYNSTNSNYNDGRLFTIECDWSSGSVIFQTASSSTSWNTFTYPSQAGNSMKKLKVIIKKNGNDLNIQLYINGEKKHDANSTDFTNGHWQPNFFAENTDGTNAPSYWGIKSGEYIVMSETSLYIDGNKIFGT